MFNDVGKKIKTLVKVVTIILMVISVIVVFFGDKNLGLDDDGIGVLVAIGKVLVDWIVVWAGGLALYGFGELVDKVSAIEAHLNGDDSGLITEEECQDIVLQQK